MFWGDACMRWDVAVVARVMPFGLAFSEAIQCCVLCIQGKGKGQETKEKQMRWWKRVEIKLVFNIWRNPPSLFSTVSITLAFNLIFNGVFLSKIVFPFECLFLSLTTQKLPPSALSLPLSVLNSLSNGMYLILLYATYLHMLTNYFECIHVCHCYLYTCQIYQNAFRCDLGANGDH